MSFHWIPTSVGQSFDESSAVYGGHDTDGSPIYVGRAFHEGNLLPAKIIPLKNACYVSNNGAEIFIPNFERLSGTGFTWVPKSHGAVPDDTVVSGSTASGEPIYIARAHHEGSLTPGKVITSNACMFIPYGGKEEEIFWYEALVCQAPQGVHWVPTTAHDPLPADAILAGNEADGSPIFVGKAHHMGETLPAKVIPSKNVAFILTSGNEHPKYTYEVLCGGNPQWVHIEDGQILPNAIPGGVSNSGETLFIGRAWLEGALICGGVVPSQGGNLYVSFNGGGFTYGSYELLVE